MMNRRLVLKRILKGLGGLFMIAGIGVVAFAIKSGIGSGGGRIQEEKAKIRAMGYPTSFSEFVRKHPINDPEDNAAEAYRALSKREGEIKLLTDRQSKDGLGNGLREPIDYVALAQLDKDASWLLREVEEISSHPLLFMPEHWDLATSDTLLSSTNGRTLIKFATIHALVLAHRGDRPAGIRYLKHAVRIASHEGQGADIMAGLAQVAEESIMFAGIHRMVELRPLTPADRSALKELSASFGPALRYPDLLEREAIMVERRVLSTAPAQSNLTPEWAVVQENSYQIPNWGPLKEAMLGSIWHSFRRHYELTKPKEVTYLKQAKAAETVGLELEKGTLIDAPASSMVGAFRQAAMAAAKTQVYRDMVQMLADGSELHPKGLDPCSDKPYIVKKDGTWLIVYSVSSDGQDDGGRFYKEKNDTDPNHKVDIGLRIPLAR